MIVGPSWAAQAGTLPGCCHTSRRFESWTAQSCKCEGGWRNADLCASQSENFTGPTEEILDEYNITTVDSAHGTDGNVDVTYSRYFYSLTSEFLVPTVSFKSFRPWLIAYTENHVAANAELGITLVEDQADGNAVGGYYNPHNIDPDTVTRCSAEEAQYDTAKNRSNFQLITGQQVTRLIMDASNGTARVTGVEVRIPYLAVRKYES